MKRRTKTKKKLNYKRIKIIIQYAIKTYKKSISYSFIFTRYLE